MKLIKYYCVLFSLFALTSSCAKKFLEVPDPGTALRQAYVTDLKTTADFLNGIYIVLAQDFYYGFNQVYPDLIADNIKLKNAASSTLGAQYNWSQFSDANTGNGGKNMNAVWLFGYQIIRSCNFVLEKAEEYRNKDLIKADNLRAQALALRAFVHFTLVNIFAQPYGFTTDASHLGVPYITTYDYTKPVSARNTVGEVYVNIIRDLELSIPLFGTGTVNKFFMNRNAAKAILARVYLYKSDYQSAKNQAREISNTVPIMPAGISGYPSKLFTTNESEALFQLSPSYAGITLPSSTGSYTGTFFTTFQGLLFISQKLFVATGDIANILTQNPTDLRKGWVTMNSGTWDITKYPLSVVSGFSGYESGSYYVTLIRSSEMYLTAAEAYTQLNNEDSARYYLNQIRTRANIPAVTASIVGGDLRDSIYLERRRELAFEGFRMFDLLRLKKGVNRLDAWNPTFQTLSYPNNKAIAPLPINDVNSVGLSQNIGY